MPAVNKMFIKIVFVLVILLTVIFVLLINWLNNPYGLEAERLGPKGNESIPPINLIDNAKNYLLFPKYDKNHFIVHLPLPNEYIHSSNTTTELVKSYASSVSMFYPELNGKYHPENANLPECNGYCGGYISAFIEPTLSDVLIKNKKMLERLHKSRVQDDPLRNYKVLERDFGLDDHFQISFPVIEQKSGGNKYSTEEYLLKRDEDGNVKYLFKCSPYKPSPACKVTFNLSSIPELTVHISFGRHLMTDWEDVIQSVDNKIASWGPSTLRVIE